MNEFSPLHDVHFLETVFDEVFYCLYVVICNLFDLFDLCSILWSHVSVDVSELFESTVVKISQLWKWNLAECDEVFDFDAYAILDKCVFAEIFSKWFCLT